MSVRAAIRRMLAVRRSTARDPRWLRLATLPVLGPITRRISSLWRWILATVALSLAVSPLPLVGGLGYELALAAALWAAVAGLAVGARLAHELQAAPPSGDDAGAPPGRALARSTAAAAGLALGLLAIPAVVAAARALWVPTCDWGFGLAAYAALPLSTAALAGAAGHLLGVIAGPRPALALVLGGAALLGVAAAALWRFYAAPPVFTYNAILGYFPGNLYDELIELSAPLAWSRLEQALWIVAAGGAVAALLDVPSFRARLRPRLAARRVAPLALAVAAATAAGALHARAGDLGYAIDAEDIEVALGGRRETAHFVIHYAATPEIEAEIGLIAADHELRLAQVTALLGVRPTRKLRSFYFADQDQKARLFGARDVEMAKPWRREIYVEHRAFPHPVIRHEIAHAVAAELGDPVFGVAARRVLGVPVWLSPGLIEGLAVALDWPAGYDRPTPHESVRALQELGALPSIDQLLGLSFFTVASAKSYTVAGSFLRFLLERHGPARLGVLYGTGGDWQRAYAVPRAQLEAEWRAMIAQIALAPRTVESARERFRAGSVFARPCPHAVAARRAAAAAARAAGDAAGAIAELSEACELAPDEPRYRLELGDALAASADPIDRALGERLWAQVATDATRVTPSLRATAYERWIDAVGGRDRDAAARLVAAARALPLELNERRGLDAKALALAHRGPAGDPLRAYFFPPPQDATPALARAEAAVAAEPALGITHYLVGLQRHARAEWGPAAVALADALARPLPGPAFVRVAARRLAVAAYRIGDRARLAAAIAALSGLGSGDRELARDWASRLAHDASGQPSP